MGSLSDPDDQFKLDIILYGDSPAASNDDEDTDSALILGEPVDQHTLDGDEPSFKTYSQSHADTACSNDNPDWAEGTVPCPNATFHGESVFDGVTETPTAAPGDIDQSEFGTTAPTEAPDDDGSSDGDGGASPSKRPSSVSNHTELDATPTKQPSTVSNDIEILDGIDITPSSPTEMPQTSAPQTSNDIEETIPDDGDGTTTTTAPSKKPSPSPSKEPSVEEVDGTFSTSNAVEYESFYSCTVSSQEELVQTTGAGGNEELPLRFDYEIYTAAGIDDVTSVLGTFESLLTNGVASSLGLTDCPELGVSVELAVRNGGGDRFPWGGGRKLMPLEGKRRTLQKDRSTGEKERLLDSSNVVGLSVDPLDEFYTDLGRCTSVATLDAPSECSPVLGAMTVWITDVQRRRLRQLVDGEEQTEAMLLDTIETYIEENQASYLNDELLHVAYIGQRNLTTVSDPSVDGSKKVVDIGTGDGSGSNAMVVGLASATSVLFILTVFTAAWVVRRQRNREAERGFDEEQGAFPGLTPESAGVSTSDFAAEDEMTQASSPPQPEDVRTDDLFGLSGIRPSDASVASGIVRGRSDLTLLTPPSSLAARQQSYPSSYPQEGGDVGLVADVTQVYSRPPEDAKPDSESFAGPTIMDVDEESDAFRALDELAGAAGNGLDASNDTSFASARNGPDVSNDTTIASDDDDVDVPDTGVMV